MTQEISTVQKIIDVVIEFAVKYSFRALGALITVLVGFWLANQAAAAAARFFEKKGIDLALARFAAGAVKLVVIGFSLIIALGNFGITVTPFIAAIGGLAFGASLALQGPLSNYGAGLSIILTRPFTIGDTITVQGVSGIVEDIKLGATVLQDAEDGVRITIPNKSIVGEILHNSLKFRIVDQSVGIGYSDDPKRANAAIRRAIESFPEVSKAPAPQIGIREFADSSIRIGMRYWIPTGKYFQLLFEINLAVFSALKEANITIPYPQREVRIINGAFSHSESERISRS